MSKSEEHVYEIPSVSGAGTSTNTTGKRLLKSSNRCLLMTVVVCTVIMVVCIITATLIITLTGGKQPTPRPVSTTDEYAALAQRIDNLTQKLNDKDAIVARLFSEYVADIKTSLSSHINSAKQAIMEQRYDPGKRVFHSKPGPHYQMTFAQGKAHCESKGAVLATYGQLKAAYEQGMEFCACGWLADGRSAYPTIYARGGCGYASGRNTNGITICNKSLADAYCFK